MKKNTFYTIAHTTFNNFRIDKFLQTQLSDLSRTRLQNLIKNKNVKINGSIVKSPSKKIKSEDNIEVNFPPPKEAHIKASNIKLDILYEDNDLIIINKSAGVVVHPGAGNHENTIVNGLLFKYKKNLSNIGGKLRPGIIHRIDKDTSGILVVAKNNFSHSKLSKQFSDHTIQRKYLALVWGSLRPLNGKIKSLIGRNKKNRQLMTVTEMSGKNAITNYKTLKIFNIKDIPRVSLIECELETGRTHQIRVHMQYKGASLLGDKQYGKKNIKFKKINKEFESILSSLNGQVLHAKSLGFIHPKNNKLVSFESGLPKNFKKILNLLEKLSS